MKNKNKLQLSLSKTGGRNNSGQQTIYTIGGGVKRKYRLIDFKRSISFHAFVVRIEKDPIRSAFIALICYPNGILSYIIATEKMQIGTKIYNFNSLSMVKPNSTNKDDFILNSYQLKSGNSFILKMLPSGSLISNIELYPTMGSVFMRAAGVWAQIVKKYNNDYIQIKLKSGEHRLIHKDCRVTLGIVSNIYNNQNKLVKAGQTRLLGKRPIVRGRAMNPVDHPHGGRTNGGTAPKTPWGFLTKGKKTRNTLRTDKFIIINRKKAIKNK